MLRIERWAKNGVLDRMFEQLQLEQIVRIRIEAFSLDSTSVKVHPDGTGALKNRTAGHRNIARRLEHKHLYGYRGFSNGYSLLSVCRQRPRCATWTSSAVRVGTYAGESSTPDGSGL
jgi:hypothetical protein